MILTLMTVGLATTSFACAVFFLRICSHESIANELTLNVTLVYLDQNNLILNRVVLVVAAGFNLVFVFPRHCPCLESLSSAFFSTVNCTKSFAVKTAFGRIDSHFDFISLKDCLRISSV